MFSSLSFSPAMMPTQVSSPSYMYGGVTVGPPARNGFWAKMAAALGVTQLIIGVSCIVFHVIAFFIDKSSDQPIHYLGEGILTGGIVSVLSLMSRV